MQITTALQIVLQAAANYHGTRQDHQQIFEAEQELKKFIDEKLGQEIQINNVEK